MCQIHVIDSANGGNLVVEFLGQKIENGLFVLRIFGVHFKQDLGQILMNRAFATLEHRQFVVFHIQFDESNVLDLHVVQSANMDFLFGQCLSRSWDTNGCLSRGRNQRLKLSRERRRPSLQPAFGQGLCWVLSWDRFCNRRVGHIGNMKQTGSSAVETANLQGIVVAFALFFGAQCHVDARDLVGFVGQGDTPTQGIIRGFLRFECVYVLAMIGQCDAVRARMSPNVQHGPVGVAQLLGPFDEGLFKQSVVSIIVDVDAG